MIYVTRGGREHIDLFYFTISSEQELRQKTIKGMFIHMHAWDNVCV